MQRFRELIAQDLKANVGQCGFLKGISAFVYHPGFSTLLVHRIVQWLSQFGFGRLANLLWRWNTNRSACHFHPGSIISGGLNLPHATGIVIGEGAIVGNNVTLYQGVTLGRSMTQAVYPVIEDNVVIYPNAIVIGDIRVGKNSVIGAGLLIDHNVDADVVVSRSHQNVVRVRRSVASE
jgi:serine O-acetyltransferase